MGTWDVKHGGGDMGVGEWDMGTWDVEYGVGDMGVGKWDMGTWDVGTRGHGHGDV